MVDDREMVEMIKQAYEELKTRDIGKEELLDWLKRNGLTLEQASMAIHLAIQQGLIRFCYPPSVCGEEPVPSYERITEEDLLPPELLEEMRTRIFEESVERRK
ncbi:MAG: hypothetical protein WED05_03280 [Candidatus Atabeyarchaeum deiterrae]